ncbi:prolyl oligopeptidase family serine peptidase [Lysinibacillus louembei]|uniref:Prolyl oligopeptidase family serine peptidase n=1 Tax=Lysinibacillus louembei TaxID=1470088 RepID=A0ABZ0RZW5_9BACI|nr:prolyl oligopeptidase family serine peptidase [Lysinibacillus louembei]WPK12348.1 prolyl oligopeptidase family serine peptidase [Lysinibacillus louembei]
MIVQREVWEHIPLLHVHTKEMTIESPSVIFIHGFGSAKEHNLHFAYQLVEKGVRVILPDAHLHGERAKPNTSTQQLEPVFWDIVTRTVGEVETIEEALQNKGLLANNTIGIAGTSMGGIVTVGCLSQYDWIQAAGVCMGATSYKKFAEHQLAQFAKAGVQLPFTEQELAHTMTALAAYDLENKEDILQRVPTIFWHGKQDQVVPFEMSYPYFEKHGENSRSAYMVDEKAGHAVSRAGMLAVTDWLAQHLA